MLNKKVSFFYIFLSILLSCGITYLITAKTSLQTISSANAKENTLSTGGPFCKIKIAREPGYKYVKPLLFAEQDCESEKFTGLKGDIASLESNLKNAGIVNSVSVYLRVFKDGDWMAYNPSETYNPGSLIKIPVLMTYLHQSEENPLLLSKETTYHGSDGNAPHQTFTSKTLVPGHTYTIRELLHYMIAYSDNEATDLLHENLDIEAFKKIFTDLGLAEPDISDKNFQITASDYSVFIKALFNASYLSKKNSEFAVSLMADCDFKDGIVKSLPPTIVVAHKFGEGGTMQVKQLHETAIVYLNNTPYLITIMTKGPDVKKLPDVISQISRLVYDNLTARS